MTGNEIFIRKDGSYTFKWDSADEVICGDSTPDIEGAFGSSFYWKGFSINAIFSYRYGGQAFLSTLFNKVENISDVQVKYNQDKRALYGRWQKPGDIAKLPTTTHWNCLLCLWDMKPLPENGCNPSVLLHSMCASMVITSSAYLPSKKNVVSIIRSPEKYQPL